MANMAGGWYLKEWRKKRGLTLLALAEKVDASVGYLSDLESGKRRHNSDWLAKLATALDASPADLLRSPEEVGSAQRRTVPVVGYVGAGAEAHLFAHGQGPFDEVPAPENATAATVAVEVRGESLGSFFDTWLVYYDDVRSPVTPDLIGRLCVVGLTDDRILVKKLQKAREPGLYHLLSQTEAPIFDAPVAWAARVTSMTPR